jgi:hypothetical protein
VIVHAKFTRNPVHFYISKSIRKSAKVQIHYVGKVGFPLRNSFVVARSAEIISHPTVLHGRIEILGMPKLVERAVGLEPFVDESGNDVAVLDWRANAAKDAGHRTAHRG